jgi:hypothetical protein
MACSRDFEKKCTNNRKACPIVLLLNCSAKLFFHNLMFPQSSISMVNGKTL